MSAEAPAAATKPCIWCGAALHPKAVYCRTCDSFQEDVRCASCRYPMPPEAHYCSRCKAGRGIRGWLNVPQMTLSLLGTLLALGSLLATQVWNVVHRNSNTAVSFISADADYLLVDIANGGRSKSVVRDARLKFGDLGIKDALLVLVADDRSATRKVVPAEGDVRLKYLVTGLELSSPAVSRQDVLNRMDDAVLELEIFVEESNGDTPPRVDHFQGVMIAPLIEHKLSR